MRVWWVVQGSRTQNAERRTIGSYGTRNVIEVIESWFWELPTDCLVLCLFSKFYSSGDPLFLGHSPSPAFSANELSLVPTGFGAISRPIRCLQSNKNENVRKGGEPFLAPQRSGLAPEISGGLHVMKIWCSGPLKTAAANPPVCDVKTPESRLKL